MSSLPTYVLICDGDGCNERWVTTVNPPRHLGEARRRAAAQGLGWPTAAWPGASFARSVDLCPGCSKRPR